MLRYFFYFPIIVSILILGCSTNTVPLEFDQRHIETHDKLNPSDVLSISFYLDEKLDPFDYKIGPGDILRINFPSEPELNRNTLLVMSDGQISMPLLGLIQVVGKTVKETSDELNNRYITEESFLNPRLSVEITKENTRLRNFLSFVSSSTSGNNLQFTVSRNELIELPNIASIDPTGLTLQEFRDQVRASYRETFGKKLIVTINRSHKSGKASFYIIGEVKSAGVFSISDNLNIINAVAIAGGFTYRANKEDFEIKRRTENTVSDWQPATSETIVISNDIIRIKERFF